MGGSGSSGAGRQSARDEGQAQGGAQRRRFSGCNGTPNGGCGPAQRRLHPKRDQCRFGRGRGGHFSNGVQERQAPNLAIRSPGSRSGIHRRQPSQLHVANVAPAVNGQPSDGGELGAHRWSWIQATLTELIRV